MAYRPPARILLAVDFGDASARAAAVAGMLARSFGSSLTALHAESLDLPPYFTHEQLQRIQWELRTARSNAVTHVRQFVRRHGGMDARVEIVEQPVPEAILRAAADADLIVMGTHGRRGPSRWWLGSAAERVVRDAQVPVLVVRAEGAASARETIFSRPFVLGTSGAWDEAHDWAEMLAAFFGGTVENGPPDVRCDPRRLGAASLVVVPTALPSRVHETDEAIAALARTCTSPVLFVPAAADEAPAARVAVQRA